MRDGSAWAAPRQVDLGPSDSGTLVARFPPVAGARFVRVSRPGGSAVGDRDLGVAGPPARLTAPGGDDLAADGGGRTRHRHGTGPHAGRARALPVAAAAILGAVGRALALAVGRRLPGLTAQSIAGLASVGLPSVA